MSHSLKATIDGLLHLAGDDWRADVCLYEGDITEQGLGLDAADKRALQAAIGEVFHLAAVYDLG